MYFILKITFKINNIIKIINLPTVCDQLDEALNSIKDTKNILVLQYNTYNMFEYLDKFSQDRGFDIKYCDIINDGTNAIIFKYNTNNEYENTNKNKNKNKNEDDKDKEYCEKEINFIIVIILNCKNYIKFNIILQLKILDILTPY